MAEGLTAKQERFCVEYAKGGKSYSDAYRAAFNCSKMKPGTIYVTASRLKDEPKIALRIKELKDEAAERAMVSLSSHLEDLKRLRDLAERAGKFGPAVAAEIARGKASGHYVERQEVKTPAGEPFNIVVFDRGSREPV